MSELEGNAGDLRAAAAGEGEGGDNLLSSLRRFREEAGDTTRTEVFPVPNYRGRLGIRVRYSADLWDKFKKIAQRVEKDKSKRRELYAHADTLVLVTEEIVVKKDDEWHHLGEAFPEFIPVEEDRSLPLSFGDRVVSEMFQLRRPDGTLVADADGATARELVLTLFNNPLAVTQVHNQVSDWLQGDDEDEDSEEDLLGNSPGVLR